MTLDNKQTLINANAAISRSDHESFLAYCTDDTKWNFMGEQTLNGKEAVRQYMRDTYLEPPQFVVEQLIAEGDFLCAIGKISLKNKEGLWTTYSYCDVWRFQDGKMAELKAFVLEDVN